LVSIDHAGVAGELREFAGSPSAAGPGIATLTCGTLTALHAAVDRIYKLAISLPDAPLERYQRAIVGLPRSTEAERLVIQRIGQNVFRDALLDYWGRRCPLTGITDEALLRASHIRPWAECTDEDRLDVHNGLLLSALWDAAFDKGLVSFGDDGAPLPSLRLSDAAKRILYAEPARIAGLREPHLKNLAAHRARHGFVHQVDRGHSTPTDGQ